MFGEMTVYRAYLLRLWQVSEGTWRACLQEASSPERHAFADLAQLCAFLEQETNGEPTRALPDAAEQKQV